MRVPLPLLFGATLACASSAPGRPSILPRDASSAVAARWARVLAEPSDAANPTYSELVRGSLATEVRFREATLAHPAAEREHLVRTLLPIAMEASGDDDMRRFAGRLRRGSDPAEEVLFDAVVALRGRSIACPAYRAVIYGSDQRPASRLEDAFVALEVTAFAVGALADGDDELPGGCGRRPPTAALEPTVVPYLAVAAGADPDDVQTAIADLLLALH